MSENSKLLHIENLSVGFNQNDQKNLAVKNLSLTIYKGETLALVGESGSGKSITALSILKLLPYPHAFHPHGEIIFHEKNLLGLSDKLLNEIRGKTISMIFQEPMTSLNPLHNIGRQIKESLFLHQGLRGDAAQECCLKLLEQVGLNGLTRLQNAYPHQLSGGQRQRVMIAIAIANKPQLLIADEPTTALDVTVQAQILKTLAKLQHDSKMSMLFITHDLNIVRKVAHRVAVMYQGEIVEIGRVKDIFEKPKHSYTKKLLNAQLEEKPLQINETAPTILRAENLRVWFAVKKGFLRRRHSYVKAVNDLSLDIKQGQTTAIVGESGSGKTTLGLALARMIGSTGKIFFKDQEIDHFNFKKMRPLRRHIQIVFQDPYGSLSPRMSVGEIIKEGLNIHAKNLSKKEREKKLIEVLEEVQLDPAIRHRYPHEFSGGQRQRIAIARAMVLNPEFVMLDEPTSALDMSVQIQIIKLLRNLQKKYNLSYLFISHDLRVVKALAHQIIVMKAGQVVESGSASAVFTNPQRAYTRDLLNAAFNKC